MDDDNTNSQRRYWDDRLRLNWGPHGVGSLAYGRNYNAWLYRVRRHVFLDLCRDLPLVIENAHVLDVGSGTGFYIKLWQDLGAQHITGLDHSSVAINRLRRTLPGAKFQVLDIGEHNLTIPVESFDVISAMDVLFHIVDDNRYHSAIQNIHSSLRPGGLLIYSDNFIHGEAKQYKEYWKSRSLEDIEHALDRSSFEILGCIPVFVVMNSPVDSHSRLFQCIWDMSMRLVSKSETIGYALGATLYPLELVLRKLVIQGPSTKIMLCRKR